MFVGQKYIAIAPEGFSRFSFRLDFFPSLPSPFFVFFVSVVLFFVCIYICMMNRSMYVYLTDSTMQ